VRESGLGVKLSLSSPRMTLRFTGAMNCEQVEPCAGDESSMQRLLTIRECSVCRRTLPANYLGVSHARSACSSLHSSQAMIMTGWRKTAICKRFGRRRTPDDTDPTNSYPARR